MQQQQQQMLEIKSLPYLMLFLFFWGGGEGKGGCIAHYSWFLPLSKWLPLLCSISIAKYYEILQNYSQFLPVSAIFQFGNKTFCSLVSCLPCPSHPLFTCLTVSLPPPVHLPRCPPLTPCSPASLSPSHPL